jgi:hypothetical protein
MRICANPECARAFEPTKSHRLVHRFCCQRCAQRFHYIKNRPTPPAALTCTICKRFYRPRRWGVSRRVTCGRAECTAAHRVQWSREYLERPGRREKNRVAGVKSRAKMQTEGRVRRKIPLTAEQRQRRWEYSQRPDVKRHRTEQQWRRQDRLRRLARLGAMIEAAATTEEHNGAS